MVGRILYTTDELKELSLKFVPVIIKRKEREHFVEYIRSLILQRFDVIIPKKIVIVND